MKGRLFKGFMALTAVLAWVSWPVPGMAKEDVQTWELVNPAGVIKTIPIKMAARINTLEGKTIALKWNQKPNGQIFLDRVAELLKEQVPGVRIVKMYEVEPTTIPQSANMDVADQKAKLIAKYKPDLVIGSQCD